MTDGENVYSFFMDYGLISYDPEGNVRWKVPLGPFSNSMGHSSCPIMAGDNIILVIDQMVDSYIAAFDRRNGEIRWKTPREEMEGWATPLLYQPAGAAPAGVNRQPRPIGRSSRRQRQAPVEPDQLESADRGQSDPGERYHLHFWLRLRLHRVPLPLNWRNTTRITMASCRPMNMATTPI